MSVWIALDGWSLGHGIDASLGWSLLLLLLLVRGTAARKQSTWSILKSLTVTGTGNNPATNSRLPGAAANYYSGAGYLHHHSSVSSHGRVRVLTTVLISAATHVRHLLNLKYLSISLWYPRAYQTSACADDEQFSCVGATNEIKSLS